MQAPNQLAWVQSHKLSSSKPSFLDLPRELRDLVYLFALRMPGAIFIYSLDPYSARPKIRAKVVRNKDEGPFEPTPIGKSMPMALLRSCRQVHAESAEVLYRKNIFRLYSKDAGFAPIYHPLVRHIVFTTDSMIQKIFSDDLTVVNYWWRKHFWQDVLFKSTKILETFPHLDSLTFPIKSSQYGQSWKPAFFASEQKSREHRVTLAAAWFKSNCPFPSERHRQCLRLEIVAPSGVPIGAHDGSRDEYDGSRFVPDIEWDSSEFSEAFEMMKVK